MIPYNEIKTIFFDYDGTLHNSIKIYEPAFKKAYNYLVEEGYAKDREWTTDEIAYWLGFSSKEMWKEFMPNIPDEIRNKSSQIIGQEMKKLIAEDQAELYSGAIETLYYLKQKGYQLVFISNCGTYYMNTHREIFKLGQYFDTMVCSEEHNFIPKHEILSKIKNNFKEKMVIVGDRIHDIETGLKNDIYTIGCLYGFGSQDELESAHLLINHIKELKEYF